MAILAMIWGQKETIMDKPEPNFHFRLMALSYKLRDIFLPRMNILKEVEIRPGSHVLDYGCGPGGYILPLAELVGQSGKIYALDIHPLAIKMVQHIALKRQITNVETICSDCKTGLPDDSIDIVLLYDTLHTLSDPNDIIGELHRVLKPNGILSITDHHMKEDDIVTKVINTGFFGLSGKNKRTCNFSMIKRDAKEQ
jgi:ubiquinone/menaquinone biosynthesis C-methylase UbiE